jgi:hypothetical protein
MSSPPNDLLDRFSGRGTPTPGGPPVVNPRLTDPVGLQCLFAGPLHLPADGLTAALRDYHPDLREATVELCAAPARPEALTDGIQPAVLGLFAWGLHVVKLVAFPGQMPAATVDASVRPAHFDQAFKEFAYRHTAHALLYYTGYDADPLEQYVATAACAAALARFGAGVVLNETARTALPAAVLLPHDEDAGDMLAALRGLPLPLLFCGFVKLEVEGEPGVWMRTFGCHRFGLPDLAFRADGHHQGTDTFELFSNVLAYLRQTGKQLAPGHTMRVGDDDFLRLREPAEPEWYLDSEGRTLVVERVGSGEGKS